MRGAPCWGVLCHWRHVMSLALMRSLCADVPVHFASTMSHARQHPCLWCPRDLGERPKERGAMYTGENRWEERGSRAFSTSPCMGPHVSLTKWRTKWWRGKREFRSMAWGSKRTFQWHTGRKQLFKSIQVKPSYIFHIFVPLGCNNGQAWYVLQSAPYFDSVNNITESWRQHQQ
jgi:hypothetical protein